MKKKFFQREQKTGRKVKKKKKGVLSARAKDGAENNKKKT
jgi:hypothetical protein